MYKITIAIAYLTEKGKGITPFEPYIHDDLSSIADALEQAKRLRAFGYRGVTVFMYDDRREEPETITWGFVYQHAYTPAQRSA